MSGHSLDLQSICSSTIRYIFVKLETEVDETTSGKGSFVVLDPDGNVVLIDQHV